MGSVKTCAFIDDRTLVTTSYRSMQQAWQNSVAWDAATSWKVNTDKTHMLGVRTAAREPIGKEPRHHQRSPPTVHSGTRSGQSLCGQWTHSEEENAEGPRLC